MREIDQDKIASLHPLLWADFRGYTFLFDNPGPPGDAGLLHNVVDHAQLTLYQKLFKALQNGPMKPLLLGANFCSLPLESYHVTWLEGLDQGKMDQFPPEFGDALMRFCSAAEGEPDPSFFAPLGPLPKLPTEGIGFIFENLANWRGKVLAAKLRPHPDDLDTFDRLMSARKQLIQEHFGRFHPNPQELFRPFEAHISLGYFPFQSTGHNLQTYTSEWSLYLTETLQETAIRFFSISPFIFHDMVTFYRLLH
ncbi:MAG: hypothetical protein AAF206_29090 [Bacteroidota bacterium]